MKAFIFHAVHHLQAILDDVIIIAMNVYQNYQRHDVHESLFMCNFIVTVILSRSENAREDNKVGTLPLNVCHETVTTATDCIVVIIYRLCTRTITHKDTWHSYLFAR